MVCAVWGGTVCRGPASGVGLFHLLRFGMHDYWTVMQPNRRCVTVVACAYLVFFFLFLLGIYVSLISGFSVGKGR